MPAYDDYWNPEYYNPSYMKHSPTHVFDDVKFTRSSKLERERLRSDNDKSAFAWLLDWKAQGAIVLVFGVIGGGFLYTDQNALGWAFIGIVILLSSAFVVFRGILPFLKWLVGLVELNDRV